MRGGATIRHTNVCESELERITKYDDEVVSEERELVPIILTSSCC